MTCMMAKVASNVMSIYVIALHKIFPNIAEHLVSASLISIPCEKLSANFYALNRINQKLLRRLVMIAAKIQTRLT